MSQPVLALELGRGAVGDDLDLGVRADLLGDDLAAGQVRVAGHDRHLLGELGEEDALFARRVAAADDQHFLVAVEGAVAGGAEVHAGADEVVLAGDLQPPVGGAQSPAARHSCRTPSRPRCFTQRYSLVHRDPGDLLRLQDLDAEALSLEAEAVGELGAGDAFGEAGKVVQALGDPHLPTDAAALDDQRLDPFARGVEGGGQPGRPAADDDQVVEAVLGRGLQPQLGRQLGVGRLNQRGAVFEDERGDDLLAVVDLLDQGEAVLVHLHVDEVVVDPLLPEELLRHLAVAAPEGAIQLDISVCQLHPPCAQPVRGVGERTA